MSGQRKLYFRDPGGAYPSGVTQSLLLDTDAYGAVINDELFPGLQTVAGRFVLSGGAAALGILGIVPAAAGTFALVGGTSTLVHSLPAKDADSGKYRPQVAAQWANFISAFSIGIGVPDSMHMQQETSGSLSDAIGSLPLAPSTTPNNPGYNNSESPNWNCVSVDFPGSGKENFGLASASYPNLTTASFACLLYFALDASVSSDSSFLEAGGGTIKVAYTSTGKMKVIGGSASTTGTADPTSGTSGGYFPILVVWNKTADTLTLYTHEERLVCTPVGLGTTQDFYIGANYATTAAPGFSIYDCEWFGANAETITDQTAHNLLSSANWAPSWTVPNVTLTAAAGAVALTGATAVLEVGHQVVATAGSYAETGSAATLTHGGAANPSLAAAAGSFALTGSTATPEHGYQVAAGAGAFALAGSAAQLASGHRLAATAGAYAETGSAATLGVGRRLSVTAGAYSLAGGTINFGNVLPLTAGAFALSGSAAVLGHGRRVAATAGASALSGSAVVLGHGREVAPSTGAYSLSGSAAQLEVGRRVAATAGALALTGSAAALVAGGRVLTPGAGAFALSGSSATLGAGRRLAPAAGAYSLAGSATTIGVGRRVVAVAGAYAATGTAAGLRAGRDLPAAVGASSLTGTAAGLRAGRLVQVALGVFALAGDDAALVVTGGALTLAAETGALALTGGPAALAPSAAVLLAVAGAYALTGARSSSGVTRPARPGDQVFGSSAAAVVRDVGASAAVTGSPSGAVVPGAGGGVMVGDS